MHNWDTTTPTLWEWEQEQWAKDPDIIDEFYSNIKEIEDGCWIWGGITEDEDRGGYGRLYVNNHYRKAHRASYQIHKNGIPDNLLVRHTCDNPVCVNPNHLILGTVSDNINDAVERDTMDTATGEDHSQAKLTETEVKEIKARRAEILSDGNPSQREIADEFGVSDRTIRNILYGDTWTHVTADD